MHVGIGMLIIPRELFAVKRNGGERRDCNVNVLWRSCMSHRGVCRLGMNVCT